MKPLILCLTPIWLVESTDPPIFNKEMETRDRSVEHVERLDIKTGKVSARLGEKFAANVRSPTICLKFAIQLELHQLKQRLPPHPRSPPQVQTQGQQAWTASRLPNQCPVSSLWRQEEHYLHALLMSIQSLQPCIPAKDQSRLCHCHIMCIV